MRRLVLVWLVMTAVFAVAWLSAYAYVSQNERDRYAHYTDAENRRAGQQRIYLKLFSGILKADTSNALTLAPLLAQMPADAKTEVLRASARAMLAEQTASDAARKEWEKAGRVARSVRWAGYAYAGFSGVYWLVVLAVWIWSAGTVRAGKSSAGLDMPPARELARPQAQSPSSVVAERTSETQEAASGSALVDPVTFVALFLFGLMALLCVALRPLVLGGGEDMAAQAVSVAVETLFSPQSGLKYAYAPAEWHVLVWIGVGAYWSCLVWYALRGIGAKLWVRVVLVLLVWVSPAHWVALGAVIHLLNKANAGRLKA